MTLELTHDEAVVLTLLVSVGATAFEAPVPFTNNIKSKFESKFGTKISDQDIADIITKVGRLLKEQQGSETVIIDDG